MWEGNLLHFDRFQTKKIITIMRDGNLLPFDRFQTKNIYNCERAIYYILIDYREREGKLLPIDRFQTNIIIIIIWEAIYYLLTGQQQ